MYTAARQILKVEYSDGRLGDLSLGENRLF